VRADIIYIDAALLKYGPCVMEAANAPDIAGVN